MVKITHYEVYTDKGDGWKLLERFASEQRGEAIKLAKEKELDKIGVKIIKETFDVQDNSYQESIEYVSNLSKGKKAKTKQIHKDYSRTLDKKENNEEVIIVKNVSLSDQKVVGALLKLIAIIVLCLVFANVLVTLLIPVFQNFIPEELSRTLFFVIFFIIFLLLAIPLVLKKVPWHVFNATIKKKFVSTDERKFFDKAESIIKQYNLNEHFDAAIAPVFPEAPLEYKKDIVSFLSQVISNLSAHVSLRDSFNRLGIKLVIYGGCLELSRNGNLKITEANSLLQEAFNLIDGNTSDLEAFYEAKKTYNDNKIAIFLTGVGAYLMSQVIVGQELDVEILDVTFNKWEGLNKFSINDVDDTTKTREVDVMFTSIVNIKNEVLFFDSAMPNESEEKLRIVGEIRNIIYNLLSKYDGRNVIEVNGITSVQFLKLNNAIKFATEFLKDISTYQDELNDENLIFNNKCNVLEYADNEEPNLNDYVNDILEHTYNDEILTTANIKDELSNSKYKFDFLGEKKLNKTGKYVELYRLLY